MNETTPNREAKVTPHYIHRHFRCDGLLTLETMSKHKMKRKYRKFESAKTIPENPIVVCGPFYEVNPF
jgi:hypothetical protein